MEQATQNLTEFSWTPERERAAELVAVDEISDQAIADQIGISRWTLAQWKKHPEFQAKAKEYMAELEAGMRRLAIAKKRERIAALQRRWKRLEQVIEERAADPQMANVPGGKTGLLVHNVKGVGKGDNFTMIDLYEVDTGLLREMRELEAQAAKELGQLVETPVQQNTYNTNWSVLVITSDEEMQAAKKRALEQVKMLIGLGNGNT